MNQYKTIVTNELSKFYNKSLTFTLDTQKSNPKQINKTSKIKQKPIDANSTQKNTATIITSKENIK